MPDWKHPRRIDDPDLLSRLHIEWRGECAVFELGDCVPRTSLHHVHKHPRDDLRENLAPVCGSGTTGHHGKLEAHNQLVCEAFGHYLMQERPDVMFYLAAKLGSQQALAWVDRYLLRGSA
jgi:hypothetical protein